MVRNLTSFQRSRAFSLVVLVLSVASSCATTSKSGGQAELKVTSTPSNLVVRVDGEVKGATPTRVTIDLSRMPTVAVSGPGYAERECELDTKPGVGWIIGDAVLCVVIPVLGCIGFAVDAISNDWAVLRNDRCHVDLRPELSPAPATAPAAAPPR